MLVYDTRQLLNPEPGDNQCLLLSCQHSCRGQSAVCAAVPCLQARPEQQKARSPMPTRSAASLTPVPKPNAGSEGLVLLTCEPNPLLSIFVEGCLPRSILAAAALEECYQLSNAFRCRIPTIKARKRHKLATVPRAGQTVLQYQSLG
jgi:hypothetical protein